MFFFYSWYCKHKKKIKSGILDKATANIKSKEVWSQKSLLRDLVAGEVRTIETFTDAMEIMGRLRLIRCMVYLKIRGNEWSLIRTMYAAIVRAIETGEHSWSSNFDRFENILNRKIDLKFDKIKEKGKTKNQARENPP